MAYYEATYEFDLVVRKKGVKHDPYVNTLSNKDKEPEVLEELKFNTLSAREVVRKLIDYLKD